MIPTPARDPGRPRPATAPHPLPRARRRDPAPHHRPAGRDRTAAGPRALVARRALPAADQLAPAHPPPGRRDRDAVARAARRSAGSGRPHSRSCTTPRRGSSAGPPVSPAAATRRERCPMSASARTPRTCAATLGAAGPVQAGRPRAAGAAHPAGDGAPPDPEHDHRHRPVHHDRGRDARRVRRAAHRRRDPRLRVDARRRRRRPRPRAGHRHRRSAASSTRRSIGPARRSCSSASAPGCCAPSRDPTCRCWRS